MQMNKPVFFTLICVYLMMLFLTGGFAAAMALIANTPPPEVLKEVESLSDNTKGGFYASLKATEEKTKKLSETATNGFQVVLGALLGFLSAVGASMIRPRPSTEDDAVSAPKRVAVDSQKP